MAPVDWLLLAMAVGASVVIVWLMWIAAGAIVDRAKPGMGPWRMFVLQLLWFAVFMGTIWAIGTIWNTLVL